MSQSQNSQPCFELASSPSMWDAEYSTTQVIPSSTRTLPSKALKLFAELVEFSEGVHVLDAGCGNGRNAVYLAEKGCEVEAVDFSPVAIVKTKQLADSRGVSSRVRVHEACLDKQFAYAPGSFDIAIDSYVFCHFISTALKEHYRKEVGRAVKDGGYFLSTSFALDDEYYDNILRRSPNESNVVVDPRNGLTKQLYTEEEIVTFFKPAFQLIYFVNFKFVDTVLGVDYLRSVYAFLGRK